MTALDATRLKDSLNRVAKIDIDSGAAPDVESALRRLKSFRTQIAVGPEVRSSLAHQAALLTYVNIARRFALGGVIVHGDTCARSLATSVYGARLDDAVEALGGTVGDLAPGLPTLTLGSVRPDAANAAIITFSGWRGGVVSQRGSRLDESTSVVTAAVLAGALGAAEAFSMLRGELEAGRRSIGLSLWRTEADWRLPESDGPNITILPDHLWILGLGHLGQAFLWNLMLLPYGDPARVRLTLQDSDIVTESTDSTSILTQPYMIGERKTRALSRVLEQRGFTTTLIERRFDGRFQRDPSQDPTVLICGVDNSPTRGQLEAPGFPLTVEAGLGDTAQDFRAMRLHTFPNGLKDASEIWRYSPVARQASTDAPAYRKLARRSANTCGLAQLAATAVGAPFVGTVATTLMLTQLLKVLMGVAPSAIIDLDLAAIQARRVVSSSGQRMLNISFQPSAVLG